MNYQSVFKAGLLAGKVIVVTGGGASGSGTNSQAAAGSSSSAPSGAASTPKAAPKLTAAQKATQQKTNAQLNQLSHLSGADYAKASARLPNVIKKAGNLPPPKPKQPGGTCIGC